MRGDTQHWAAMSLFDRPWPDQSGDLAFHRCQGELGGRVALAGGLPGRAQLLAGAGGERLGAQVLERLERGTQVGAGVDAVLGAAQQLAVGEVGAGPVVRPAARFGVMGEGGLEQGWRVGGLGEQGPPVVERGECPRPAGALGERGELLDPRCGLLVVAGADGGVDAVDRGQAVDGADPDAGEVVQGCAGVAVVGRAGALRPAGEVVHGVAEHAERLPGRRVEVGEELVVVRGGRALERGEDGDPAEWGGGERWLPRARTERERLFGAAAQGRPSAGDELG